MGALVECVALEFPLGLKVMFRFEGDVSLQRLYWVRRRLSWETIPGQKNRRLALALMLLVPWWPIWSWSINVRRSWWGISFSACHLAWFSLRGNLLLSGRWVVGIVRQLMRLSGSCWYRCWHWSHRYYMTLLLPWQILWCRCVQSLFYS